MPPIMIPAVKSIIGFISKALDMVAEIVNRGMLMKMSIQQTCCNCTTEATGTVHHYGFICRYFMHPIR